MTDAAHPARGLRLRAVAVPPHRYTSLGWVLFVAPSGRLEGLPPALRLGTYVDVAEVRLSGRGRRFYTDDDELVLTIITDEIAGRGSQPHPWPCRPPRDDGEFGYRSKPICVLRHPALCAVWEVHPGTPFHLSLDPGATLQRS